MRLPTRTLPAELDESTVVALSDGPSSDDYDIHELFARGATMFGYGRAWQRGRLHYYVAYHDSLLEQLLESIGYGLNIFVPTVQIPLFQKRGFFRHTEHNFIELPEGECHHVAPALSWAESHARSRKLFILGEDGWHRLTGQLYTPETCHSKAVAYRAQDQPDVFKRMLEGNTKFLAGTQNRFAIAWNIRARAARAGVEVHNLSMHGWPRLILGVHPDVAAQCFANVDRAGSAVVFDVLAEPDPEASVAMEPQSWRAHKRCIVELRQTHPSLAIFVRVGPDDTDNVARELDPYDIVVGPRGERIEGRFSEVYGITLPGVLW